MVPRLPVIGLVSLALLLVGCTPTPDHYQSTFDAAGPVAQKQLDLFMLTFWVMLVVFLAVVAVLAYVLIRFRHRPGQGIPPQVHGNLRLEIFWTIIPTILIAIMAVWTVVVIFQTDAPPSENPLELRVVGHQWWWEFEYPALGIVTANEVHIPVGRDVSITLESVDVVHSFWVPKLAGKIDAIPGRKNKMWFHADQPSPEGGFYGQCAEFCGTAHALMKLRIIAEPEEEFQKWVSIQQSGVMPQIPTEARERELFEKGKELFINGKFEGGQQCVFCHTIEDDEIRFKGTIGPNLTHVGSRKTLAAGIMDNTPEDLTKWLINPPEHKPGSIMPNLGLSPEQVSALVVYLMALK